MTGKDRKYKIPETVLKSAVFWYILAAPSLAAAQQNAEGDSLINILPGVEVEGGGMRLPARKEDGGVELKGSDVMRMSRTLGEADFINQIKTLSGISSSGDYSSGFSAEGADATQVRYMADGVPVTFPYRFGGIFSVFNPAFYGSMDYSPQTPVSLPPGLGPSLSFRSASRFRSGVEGSVSAGLMASSLGIRGGIAEKVAVMVGGRVSYVDQVYGKWLNRSSHALGFSFHDINAAAAWKITPSDILRLTLFESADRVGYDDRSYSIDTRLHWRNAHSSLGFSHRGPINIEATLYATRFRNTLTLEMPQFQLYGPSSLDSYGGHLEIGSRNENAFISGWEAGGNAVAAKALPQSAKMKMSGAADERSSGVVRQRMLNLSLFGGVTMTISPDKAYLHVGLAAGGYGSKTEGEIYRRFYLTPKADFSYHLPDGELTLSASLPVQPLHQVGFSELGLASDFWIGANRQAPLQHGFVISARAFHRLPWWNLYAEGNIYWKRLRNQAEYQGHVLEVVDIDYDPFSHLIISDGDNYGFSIGIGRRIGRLTGDISYSYSDGRRHLRDDSSYSWHALNASGSALKSSLLWKAGPRWLLSASFRFTSGRRYTPVEALYAIGNNVAMEYGRRNSARLPSYQRLDLSATYSFSTGSKVRLHHLVNISLLNAYGHRNVEMQYFILDTDKGTYSLKRLYSLYRFLPSLSYTLEFK